MILPVAVEGMTLVPDDPTVVCTIAISDPASLYSKVDGKAVYVDGLTISITGITVPSAGATIADPGPKTGSFESTAVYCRDETMLVLLEGDKTGTINATPKIPGSPPIDYPVSFNVEIEASNQNKAEGE